MIKKLLSIALSALICLNSVAHADWKQSITTGWWKGNFGKSVILENLKQYQGLVFFKDTRRGTVTFADRALGSSVGVYTSTRSASNPATWIDSTGRINVSTTSNVPLKNYGYYDETGFHPKELGYSAFRSSTNLLTRTDGTAYSGGVWTGWTSSGTRTGTPTNTNNEIPELTSIAGATSQRIRYTGVAGDSGGKTLLLNTSSTSVGSIVQNDVVSLSFYARSLTSNPVGNFRAVIVIQNSSGTGLTSSTTSTFVLTPDFKKFTHYITATDATSSKAFVSFGIPTGSIVEGSVVDIEIACPQLEKLPYATPFIPTTTTALTRNADVLKWENAGNRNASEETIIIGVIPYSTFDNLSARWLISTTGASLRSIGDSSAGSTDIQSFANQSEASKFARTNEIPQALVPLIISSSYNHSSPYITMYSNGVAKSNYTASDWTEQTLGTYFEVGSNGSSVYQLDGFIPFIAVWNRALSAAEIKEISQILTYN